MLASPGSRFPVNGLPALVKDRDDGGKLANNYEVDAVGKFTKQCTLDFISDDGKLRRILADPLKYEIDFNEQTSRSVRVARVILS